MKVYRNVALGLVVFFTILIVGVCTYYNYMLGPVSNDDSLKKISIPSGSSAGVIANILKDNGLIKDVNVFKVYVKINKNEMYPCEYELSSSMGVKKILDIISGENAKKCNMSSISVTIPEGKHFIDIANIYAKNTNNTSEELVKAWNSPSFVKDVIDKYWFVTDSVLDSNIRYSLEGYFFPAKYEFMNKDVSPSSIAYTMLDKMGEVLNKYRNLIENSKYSVHELLTLASIVEYEAILDEDRPVIAGVFYNRLDRGMLLQSCATVGYAIDEWKLSYSSSDLQTDSKYNTYKYSGLPVGPGNSPGEKSILAALEPVDSDYLYFLANVCDKDSKKTYFSKTYEEHSAKKRKYLTCLN